MITTAMIGQVYGQLTVTGLGLLNKRTALTCRCMCGRDTVATKRRLLTGRTKSCGCLRLAGTGACQTTHGRTNSTEYHIWRSMKQRCYDQNRAAFSIYGGRGISVCDRWRDSFENFYADMGPKPLGLTIERLDNDGNYEPSNCEWRSRTAQANNRRSSKMLTHDGRTQTAAQWSRETGISQATIYARQRLGWPIHFVLTVPPSASNRLTNAVTQVE